MFPVILGNQRFGDFRKIGYLNDCELFCLQQIFNKLNAF